MSTVLLQRVKTLIVDTGTLLAGYDIKYYRWTDTDLDGTGTVALFRMTGTAGNSNRHVQHQDVSLYLMASRGDVTQADADMLGVIRYLRGTFSTTGAFNVVPLGAYTGPVFLQNGRAIFEQVLRVGTTDH